MDAAPAGDGAGVVDLERAQVENGVIGHRVNTDARGNSVSKAEFGALVYMILSAAR